MGRANDQDKKFLRNDASFLNEIKRKLGRDRGVNKATMGDIGKQLEKNA